MVMAHDLAVCGWHLPYYGKDGWSPMQCGNPPCVSKMEEERYFKNINADSTYKQTCHYAQQRNPNNLLQHFNASPAKHPLCLEVLFHQKKFSLLHYHGDHLSDFLTFHSNWYFSVENSSSKFTHCPSWATNSMYLLEVYQAIQHSRGYAGIFYLLSLLISNLASIL